MMNISKELDQYVNDYKMEDFEIAWLTDEQLEMFKSDFKVITGRTHQIRAHLAYLGKPVLGDIKYGNRKMNERTGTRTQALCAVRISFLDIPEENTLHYLSGKVIKLKDPQIVKQFDTLDKNKQAPAEEK